MVKSMSPRFPLFLDLQSKPCLVVGGGQVATRRVETLLRCGAFVTVISPAFSEALVAWACAMPFDHASLQLVERKFIPLDILGKQLVVASTDDREVNQQVGSLAHEAKIPVTVADAQQESSFHFPSLVVRGEMSVGINTNGQNPSASKQIREIIEMVLPEDLGERLGSRNK